MRPHARAILFAALLSGFALEAGAETFVELYRQALATNPALKAQEFAVDRATARKDQARSRLLPQLSASATYGRNEFHARGAATDEYGSKRRVIQARQTLFDLAAYHLLGAERARILQSQEELAAVKMEVAQEVVDRYLEVLGATDELDYLQAEKEATESQRTRLRRMHERQLAKVTDLYEVEAYYAALETREIEARNARAVALEKLRETVGTPVQAVLPLNRDSFPAVTRPADEWVRDGTQGNRSLAALQHAIEAEEKSVSGARSQHAPQLALVASKTWADTDADYRRNPPYDVATVGVQLNLPIFEGGRVDGAVRESIARREIARQQYEEGRREVEREIRTAYLKTQADISRIEATGQAVRAQEKARDAQQKGFELGTSTVVDLLDAQRRLFRARADRSAARHDFIRSLTALRLQAGVLSEAHLEELDGWLVRR